MKPGILPRTCIRSMWWASSSLIFRSAICQQRRTNSFQTKSKDRNLNVKDLNSALKPFFFMVHPDLFGKYPDKRLTNENSLKKLNSFLQECVTRRHQSNEPLTLKFFVRDPDLQDFESIDRIFISLNGKNPFAVVEEILKSVRLPGLLQKGEELVSPRPNVRRHINHDMSMYQSQKPDYDDIPVSKTLLTFLGKNFALARNRLERSSEIKQKTTTLVEKICYDFGFKTLTFETSWKILMLYGYLKNMHEFLSRHKNIVQNAAGWEVVLSSWSGVDKAGALHLNIEDEPLTWIKLLQSLHEFLPMLEETENLKSAISQMLGGLIITSDDQHYKKSHHLDCFLASLKDLYSNLYLASFQKLEDNLCNYEAVISSSAKGASVLPNGSFLIPASTNGLDIISFLKRSASEAKYVMEIYERQVDKERSITEHTIENFGLRSLHRNTDVNHEEMISCCEHLINLDCNIPMQELVVNVGKMYYLSGDGELTIPWNWQENSCV